MANNLENKLPKDVEAKLQSVESDLQYFRETGDPKYLHYAEPKLQKLIGMQRSQWTPEVDAK